MSVPVSVSRKHFSRSKVQVYDEQTHDSQEIGGIEPDDVEQGSRRVTEDPFADLKNGGANDSTPTEAPLPPPPSPTDGLGFEVSMDDMLALGVKAKRGGGGNRGKKKNSVPQPLPEFEGIFGDPTPILGRDRRELLTKVKEFKCLFPDELGSFKVKQNATPEELQASIDEMETIVSCGTVQRMLDEACLAAIQVVEGVSSRTTHLDISGTSEALRANPEFFRLCKLCWIKYRVFSQCPTEVQLTLVVASAAMLCRQQNVKKKAITNILNQSV